MDKADFMSSLEQILELEPDTLQGSEKLDDLEGWDSLAVISYIAMVDEKTGRVVNGESLAEARSVADLFALVQ